MAASGFLRSWAIWAENRPSSASSTTRVRRATAATITSRVAAAPTTPTAAVPRSTGPAFAADARKMA